MLLCEVLKLQKNYFYDFATGIHIILLMKNLICEKKNTVFQVENHFLFQSVKMKFYLHISLAGIAFVS